MCIRDRAYIDTVYFGGGTPSFYGAARLIELLDAVKATGRLLKRAEVTVEVNPDSVRLQDVYKRQGAVCCTRRRSSGALRRGCAAAFSVHMSALCGFRCRAGRC